MPLIWKRQFRAPPVHGTKIINTKIINIYISIQSLYMKRLCLSFLSLLLLTSAAEAQFISGIKPLTIGDTLPDIVLKHVIRYKTDSIRTGDLRGKVVILDFFATWCGSCIAAMPHLDSLQQYFGDKIQALVIDYEPTHKVDSAFRRNKRISPLVHLPVVTQDVTLSEMFPHRSYPHEVIIDANGRVQAITYPYSLTKPTIQSVIDGKMLHLTVKRELMDYSNQKPLFYYGNGGDISQVYLQSTFCHYVDGLPNYTKRFISDSTQERYLFTNEPIPTLYRMAAYPWGKWKFYRMVLEVQDSSRYIYFRQEPRDHWTRKNTYCYELTAPAHTPRATLRRYMMEDLNRSLHINGRFEKRMENCWVLVRTTGSDSMFKSRAPLPGQPSKPETFSNATMDYVAGMLNTTNAFVLNETHYTGKVDINLNVSLKDLPAVRIALHPYGLDLVPTRRMLTMLVLTEENFNDHFSKSADTTGARLTPRIIIR